MAERVPVWHALSELFLDTELDADNYARIAAVIARSSLTPAEAWTVLEREVAPAFALNLLAVAGEWSGWSAQTVRDTVLRSRRPDPIARLGRWTTRRWFGGYLRDEWAKIAIWL